MQNLKFWQNNFERIKEGLGTKIEGEGEEK
jgi:hypothetical protein